MDRRIVVIGLFAGLAAMVGAWLLLGSEERDRSPRHVLPKRFEPTLGSPVQRSPAALRRIDPRVQLRPEFALNPDRQLTPVDELKTPAEGATAPGTYRLDQDGIRQAVEAREADLQACYETAVFHTPDLAGSMTLSFVVEADPGTGLGHVASVDVDTTLDATVFEGCVVTVFEELRFEATETTTVRYPVTFSTAGDAAEDGGNPR